MVTIAYLYDGRRCWQTLDAITAAAMLPDGRLWLELRDDSELTVSDPARIAAITAYLDEAAIWVDPQLGSAPSSLESEARHG